MPIPTAIRVSMSRIIPYYPRFPATGRPPIASASFGLPVLERLSGLDVMSPRSLADQDVYVLDGGTYSLVDDARYLPGERLLLLFGTAFPDVALNDWHTSPLLARPVFRDAKSSTNTEPEPEPRPTITERLC